MKHRNWFWGIFFLAAAVFVIACQVGAFVSIGFWSIAATVLLAAVLISSLTDLNFFGIFISLALLYLIYQQPLHLIAISFWLLLLAAVLAAMGFSMIFHSRHHHHWENYSWHGHGDEAGRVEEKVDGNDIYVKSSFSESCKYLQSDNLEKARLVSSFGKLSVYFDQVQLSPQGAEAIIDVSFGEMVLYLPRSWRVVDRVHTGVGAVSNDARGMTPDAGTPTLTLTGSVSFGNLAIRYI